MNVKIDFAAFHSIEKLGYTFVKVSMYGLKLFKHCSNYSIFQVKREQVLTRPEDCTSKLSLVCLLGVVLVESESGH